MSLKKKHFNIFPRKYSYGGLMDTLSKSVPLASKLNLMINVIDLNINVKKVGNLIVKDISNLNDNEYSNTTSKFETSKKEPVVAEATTNLEDSDVLKW